VVWQIGKLTRLFIVSNFPKEGTFMDTDTLIIVINTLTNSYLLSIKEVAWQQFERVVRPYLRINKISLIQVGDGDDWHLELGRIRYYGGKPAIRPISDIVPDDIAFCLNAVVGLPGQTRQLASFMPEFNLEPKEINAE